MRADSSRHPPNPLSGPPVCPWTRLGIRFAYLASGANTLPPQAFHWAFRSTLLNVAAKATALLLRASEREGNTGYRAIGGVRIAKNRNRLADRPIMLLVR